MRPIRVSVGPLATASATALAAAQSGTAGTPLTLTGTALDTPRRVGITSSGNDAGITFLIKGSNWSGAPVSETLQGANASTAQSALDYAVVSSVTPSGNTAGTASVGTTGVASSAWIALDVYGWPTAAIQCEVTGTVNYTLEQSLDNPNDPVAPVAPAAMRWVAASDINGATTDALSNYAYGVPRWCRVTLNGGTGSVVMIVAQSGGRVS